MSGQIMSMQKVLLLKTPILPSLAFSLLLLCALCTYVDCHGTHISVDNANSTAEDSRSCWDGTVPCKTVTYGLEGLRHENYSTLWVKPGRNGSYLINSSIKEFMRSSNIAILGSENGSSPIMLYCVGTPAGLAFINSSNITIKGIALFGCGALRISTSKNFTESELDDSYFQFAEFHATLYFLYCKDVNLQFVEVQESSGIGAVFYSTVGQNIISNCKFYGNKVTESRNTPGGGGLYIEFSYCTPSIDGEYENCSIKSNVPPYYAANATYVISECVFDSNNASIAHPENHTFILPHNSTHLAFGRGGGISVFFKGNANNNVITIDNCSMSNNTAYWGAGLFVEYQDMSHKNNIFIRDSIIDSNHVAAFASSHGTGGGGARVGFIFFYDSHSQHNLIQFDNVTFYENRAYFGGGLSFYTARENTSIASNRLIFNNCTWTCNTARVGAAVDLSVWHPITEGATVKPVFSSCSFRSNNADYTGVSVSGEFVGLGAMFSDSIPVTFKDYVKFSHNTQTALAAVGAGFHFSENTVGKFHNNSGRKGGAVALMGAAFIEVSANTQLHFTKNSARLKGGAIYGHSIGEHDLISSRDCYIRYSDIYQTPNEWNATFYFEDNNVKNKPNSIYITSLLTCLWGGAFGSTDLDEAVKEVFCWNDKMTRWHYPNGNCTMHIETSPAKFWPINHNTTYYNMAIFPGKREKLPFSTFDDQCNNVTQYTVLIAQMETATNTTGEDIFLEENSEPAYISDDMIEVHGSPLTTGTVRIETIDPRVIYTQINVTLNDCPPGMKLVNSSCICGDDYNRLITCDQNEFYTMLQRGSWIGLYKGKMLVGQCPYCAGIFANSNTTGEFDLYMKLDSSDSRNIGNDLCSKINREGTLCANCQKGYGPAVNSENFMCVQCSDDDQRKNWVFYLLTEFLPITIFFFIIVLFNVSVTSGPANAFVFFAQMSTTAINLNGDGLLQVNKNVDSLLRIVPYDIWNLNFFRPYLPKFCLSSDITTLKLLATGYVTAFYPLVLVAIFSLLSWFYSQGFKPVVLVCRPIHACFARVSRIWDFQKSILHALATFLLLSYTKFTLVSFILLTATPLIEDNGDTHSYQLYYDGEIVFLSTEHLQYLIPSVIVLATFVAIPPLILIVPSAIHILQRWCGRAPDLCGGAIFNQFLNTFHGCYKDGTGGEDNKYDCRWFAGLYFILRVVLLAIYAFTADWFVQSVGQLLVSLIALLAFVIFRPYKNDLYNKVDSTFFGIIIALCALSMYSYYSSIVQLRLYNWIFVIQYLLLACPMVYIAVVVIYFFWNRNSTLFKRLYRTCVEKLRSRSEELVQNDDDFFQDAEEAGRFGNRNRDTLSQQESQCRLSEQSEERQPLLVNEQSLPYSGENLEGQQTRSNESGSSYGAAQMSTGTQTSTTPGDSIHDTGVGKLEVEIPEDEPKVQISLLSKKRKNLFFTR